MHPSWPQSESECLLIMSENDRWFAERKLGFISRCCPGRQPSLEEGAGWGANSRNIKARSWLGDRAYIREGQQEPTLFCQWGQQWHTVRPQPTALRHKMWGSPSNNSSQKRPQTASQITIRSVTHFINPFAYFQRTWEQRTSCRCFPHFIGLKVPINGAIRAAVLAWLYMCFRLPASLKSLWQRSHSNKQWFMTLKGASSSSCLAPWLIIHDMRPTCTPLIFMPFLTITVAFVGFFSFHSRSDIKCLCGPFVSSDYRNFTSEQN